MAVHLKKKDMSLQINDLHNKFRVILKRNIRFPYMKIKDDK